MLEPSETSGGKVEHEVLNLFDGSRLNFDATPLQEALEIEHEGVTVLCFLRPSSLKPD